MSAKTDSGDEAPSEVYAEVPDDGRREKQTVDPNALDPLSHLTLTCSTDDS